MRQNEHPFRYRLKHYFYTMQSFEEDIRQCLATLRNGGVIVYPTDTIWGIGCDATNMEAVEKIINLKNRPVQKSFVVLVADERELMQHVASLDLEVFNYLDQTVKPTTVIYDHAIGLADNVLANNGSVAIRICKDEFCKHLIKRFGKPVVSTSANVSGEPSPAVFKDIAPAIVSGADYVVQYHQQENKPAQASSIIHWKNGKAVMIRP
jgi:L-threonylcarbamoyladenylate synthase